MPRQAGTAPVGATISIGPTRSFFAPAGTPTIVNTAFIDQACLDMVELSGSQGPPAWSCEAPAMAHGCR